MTKIFIDGSAGTTGLRIHERLAGRNDLCLVTLSEETRKDPEARKAALNEADIAFLCLPDSAAMESVSMVENPHTAIIDTSTAHRTAKGWTYGLPELSGKREEIRASKRIANPGCHASGFVALVTPLVQSGILSVDAKISAYSFTGYSGGGKKMIAEYEDENRDKLLNAPRLYGLGQTHKHLKEMVAVSGLQTAPIFCPVVAPFYSGMEVSVPLFRSDLNGGLEEIQNVYRTYYRNGLIHFVENGDEAGFVSAGAFADRDDMQITVTGNAERILLIARFDNLGKGASGAAIQNMNLLLGVEESTGLSV